METIETLQKEIASLKEQNSKLQLTLSDVKIDTQYATSLKDNNLRFRTIFESSRLGNKIIGSDLTILEVNAAMLSLLGYDRKEELIGTRILDYTPQEYHQHWKQLQESLWRNASPSFSLETCLRKKDGSLMWCNINSIIFQDNDKTYGFTIIENITVKRELRVHKDEFINIASHELKTPLTSLKAVIQLFNRIIKKDPVITEKVIELARNAEHYVEKLTRLVEDLLNSTRMGEGQLKLTKSKFTLKDLLDGCCNHVRLSGTHQIKHTGDLSLEVIADKYKLDQVLVNLVNNAVKYAPGAVDIIIHVEDLQDNVMISVIDEGTGISEDYIPFLFDRYYRVNQDGNQNSGLGLGLFISAEIIRKHGGAIGVKSELGRGSSFWFTIPKDI